MVLFSEERIYERNNDDEFMNAFIEIAESGIMADWAKEQLYHEGVYMVNPLKYRLAHMLYIQIKHILDECCASYIAIIRKDRFINNLVIEVQTDDLNISKDTLNAFRFIANTADGFNYRIGYGEFKHKNGTLTKDAIVMSIIISDGFIELTNDAIEN